MVWKRLSWQIRLLEMGLPYSGKLWHDQRWRFSLASGSETQESLFLSTWHSGIHDHIPSSGDQ